MIFRMSNNKTSLSEWYKYCYAFDWLFDDLWPFPWCHWWAPDWLPVPASPPASLSWRCVVLWWDPSATLTSHMPTEYQEYVGVVKSIKYINLFANHRFYLSDKQNGQVFVKEASTIPKLLFEFSLAFQNWGLISEDLYRTLNKYQSLAEIFH